MAVSSVGRPELHELLLSLAASDLPPVAVAVADQSGGDLEVQARSLPFPVTVVPSCGGVSRGRNDAVAALAGAGEVLGFPNDDTVYGSGLLRSVLECFGDSDRTAAVACRLEEPGGPRFALPPPGTELSRRSVWRAIEPATFVRRRSFEDVGGFDVRIGSGSATAYGSGEGTDLLLRLMDGGGQVVSRPDLVVQGRGERRQLDAGSLVRKHRSYARGTGYVYRVHSYPLSARLLTVAGPVVRARRHDPELALSLRIAVARLLGRVEGLTGRSLEPGRGFARRWQP